jgi:4-oxalocrotonate tautomerase
MPMITVRYVTSSPQPELGAKIAELVARLGDEKLGKDPGVTAVLVEPADRQSWFIMAENGILAHREYRIGVRESTY